MRVRISILLVLVTFVTSVFPDFALAQSRGGSCRTELCQFTGGVVFLILIAAFFFSLSESIRRHGFWKGIFRHSGVQIIVMYLLTIGSGILLIGAAYELGGKNAAITVCLVSIAVIYFFVLPRVEKKPDE